MTNRSFPRLALFLSPVVILIGALIAPGIPGTTAAHAQTAPDDIYALFDPIIDVYSEINARFVTDPDMRAIQQAAINGMIEALGDRYTEYVSAEDLAEFDKQLRGEYIGIGASVRMEDDWLTIVSPLEGSPAFFAGIIPGDRIVAIEGESTAGVSINQSIAKLTGKPGEPVSVTVERGEDQFDVVIVREQIVTRTVHGFQRANVDQWNYMIDPETKIGYVRVSQFTGGTTAEFDAALSQLLDEDVRGVILDLRFNPGGLLNTAAEMADRFLDSGLIVSTKGRAIAEDHIYATPQTMAPDLPLIIILNRQSASASEVVSGALRDNGRATVLGTRSFGKGSVQAVVPLPSGQGQLKITEQRYYGPSGKVIHREDDSSEWGVDPTEGFYVPMTNDEYNAMLTIRREREVIHNEGRADQAPISESPDDVLAALNDKQLSAAVHALRLRLTEGDWIPVGEDDGEEALRIAELRRMQLTRERLLREMQRVDVRVKSLSSVVDDEDRELEPLVPDSVGLSGGRLEIFDDTGELIAVFNITGEGLPRWLIDAPIEKREPAQTN